MKSRQGNFFSQDYIARSLKPEVTGQTRQSLTTQLLSILVGVTLIPLGGCNLGSSREAQVQPSPSVQSPVVNSSVESNNRTAALPSISDPNFVVAAVKQVGPAVVRINASKTVASRLPEAYNDPVLRSTLR